MRTNAPPIVIYCYQGDIERGTATMRNPRVGYRWHNGYAEQGTAPWMTKRECQLEARQRGLQARFCELREPHDHVPAVTRDPNHPEPFLAVYTNHDGGFCAYNYPTRAALEAGLTALMTDSDGDRCFSADDEAFFLFQWIGSSASWVSLGQVNEDGLFPWEVDDERLD